MRKNNLLNLALLTTFLLFTEGQIGRISFFEGEANIYIYEFILIGIVLYFYIVFFIRFLESNSKVKHLYNLLYIKPYRSLLIFAVIIFGSFIITLPWFNLRQNLVGFLYLGRLFLYGSFLIFCLKKKLSLVYIKKGLMLLTLFTILFSFVQYFIFPDLFFIKFLGWDPHLYRSVGLFFDASISGAIFSLLFFYYLCIIFLRLKNKVLFSNLKFEIIFVFLLAILILLSYSRNTYISFILTLVFAGVSIFKPKNIIFLIIVFLGMIFVLPRPEGEGVKLERSFSIESRIQDQKNGINIFKDSPLFGFGYNRIRYIKSTEKVNSHAGGAFSSSYITILVTSGILGFLGFLFVLFELLAISNKYSRLPFFFVLIASFFENIILVNFILFIFILIFCVLQKEISNYNSS